MKHANVTDKIIAGFYTVYNTLGYGFLEGVYKQAMVIELEKTGLRVQPNHPIRVWYDGHMVGEYLADLLVDSKVIVELKAVNALAIQHESQLLNYLNATEYEVGLLLNFGPVPQFKRKVFDNERKKYRFTDWHG